MREGEGRDEGGGGEGRGSGGVKHWPIRCVCESCGIILCVCVGVGGGGENEFSAEKHGKVYNDYVSS